MKEKNLKEQLDYIQEAIDSQIDIYEAEVKDSLQKKVDQIYSVTGCIVSGFEISIYRHSSMGVVDKTVIPDVKIKIIK